MPEKSPIARKPALAGLWFCLGRRSWFWGWGKRPSWLTPQTQRPKVVSPARPLPWPEVAAWLRRMHAQAELPATGAARRSE
jgi:hypothetical protein